MKVHLLCLLGVSTLSLALLEERFVSFESTPGSVPLHDAAILYAADDPVGVRIASESIANDFEQITGGKPALIGVNATNSIDPGEVGRNAIIAGSVDSTLLQSLIQSGKVTVSEIQGKWESFKTSVVESPLPGVERALVIAGSDKRAVMFGLYTLAEQSGQSPFHWWADVPTVRHDEVYAVNKTVVFGEPSVKYRGLFINDEAPGLTGWWSKVHGVDHYPLDSEFYSHVFDMLVRLKANFMWPAMWKSFVPRPGNIFFTDDPENIHLANDYGIVISTSHHEPMQRATNEWNEAVSGPWDWEHNKDNVAAFMQEGIRRTDMNESYYTLGMRGPGDGPIPGNNPIGILRDVFTTQRSMLSDYYGNITSVNQVWTIYKEVMTYYAAGLVPPEDVTLMFTDDNWGNIQRLPTPEEAARPGGIGMYYHLEYLGIPKAYKWQNTNNLPKVYKELYQAYERGVDRIWVINVGDIKPLEMPFSFIMEMAYNMSSITFETIPDYFEAFAAREFGQEGATEIASIIMEQSRLIGRRKYESLQAWTYSVLNYHESERVMTEWNTLADRVLAVRETLPENRRHAFWHHIQYPILSGYYYHAAILGLGVNQHYGLERRNTANSVAQQVIQAFESEYDLMEEYDLMLNGKWAGILAQPHYDEYDQANGDDWKEPTRDVLTGLWYVQLRQNSTYAYGNLGIYAENTNNAWRQGRSLPSADASAPTVGGYAPVLPLIDPYGKGVWNVDLFHRGDYRIPIQWSLEIPFDWIAVSPSSGVISEERPEQRLNISIDWDAVPEGFRQEVNVRINFDTKPWFDYIRLPIRNYRAPDFTGFPEASGMISIEAPHYQRRSDGTVRFEHIPYLGTRSNSGALALRPYSDARADREAAQSQWVEYDIYLYDTSQSLHADVYVNGALDTDPTLPMQYSLTLDDAPPRWARVLGDPERPGDTPPGWRTTVADHVWRLRVDFGTVPAGVHTLRWMANSPEVYLEKIAVNTRGGLKGSYLGPPETTLLGAAVLPGADRYQKRLLK
ncbi:hypothetical protein DL770_011581 [Monosporascus sp. CRB-9-2]|nr:hypothetical protein DL770_011581 [Monosporascus sp. CRB-9-2]